MFKDNLDIKEYHQMEDINASFLITASKNCRKAEREREKPKQANHKNELGNLYSHRIETRNMEKNFYLEPYEIDGIPLRSAKTGKLLKKGEEQLEELKTQVAPKIILSQKEWDMVEGCMENAWSHPDAKILLHCASLSAADSVLSRV
jgi:predicted unusual protein kinase regulating ubiquinone biosynthesis (AarF/ABC1/UbiB family)